MKILQSLRKLKKIMYHFFKKIEGKIQNNPLKRLYITL